MSKTTRNYFNGRNLTMETDLYQFTMMQGYFLQNRQEEVVFNVFYRKNPDNGGYVIFAGLETVIDYIENLHFEEEDIDYLRSTGIFKEEFLTFLKNYRFDGTMECVPEGTVIFPNEPYLKIKAPIVTAQFVETTILNLVNYQSLIATKASRICYAAEGDNVMEFGLRRAQGPDAGVLGARASLIGGMTSTSNVYAGKLFHVSVAGTMAHSWVMSYDTEYEAFMTYANTYADHIILLVDTYDIIEGTKVAIEVFQQLKKEGRLPKTYGVRIDSGDLAYYSKVIYQMLTKAGFENFVICASNDLDEKLISDLKRKEEAKINSWGVGTKNITSYHEAALGGVYKLAQVKKDDEVIPKIKISEDEIKVTNPGEKTLYRIIDVNTGIFRADIIALEGETITNEADLKIYDPYFPSKNQILKAGSFRVENLMQKIYDKGECVYSLPELKTIQERCQNQLNSLWPEIRRFKEPHNYYVDLSDRLYDLKRNMIYEARGGKNND